jgi:hypothetical protein
MSRSPTALLIIRAWVETGSSKPLRAQVRLTTDISAGMTSEMTLTEISTISAEVQAWLHDVLLNSNAANGNSSDT